MDQNNDLSIFQRFLSEFCEKLKDRSENDNVVPVRYSNSRITPEELEGECLEWCSHFLSTRKCPVILTTALAHETYLRVSSCNLNEALVEFASEKEGSSGDSVDSNRDGDGQETSEKNQEYNAEQLHKFVLATLETVCKLWAEDLPPIPMPNWLLDIIMIELFAFVGYNAEQLHKFVLSTLETVCKLWAEDLPPIPTPNRLLEMSFQAIKNTRRKMEDSHTVVHDFNTLFGKQAEPDQSFYAVFDGHAGTEAAVFASKHLHCLLAHKCHLESDPAEAMKTAFKLTDEAFIRKAKREKLRSGTTGVTALVRGNKLYLSWLGDSQAVLVRDGRVVSSMEPHKPDRQDERDRIESQGGFVMLMGDLWRVGGNIAVSRAIGDANYKPFICSDAEVISLDLDGTEDYLVLACDGAWDTILPDDLPSLVYNHLIANNMDRSTVANMIVQTAKNNGSTDNISVIVVFFRENISEPKAVDLFNFGGFSQGEENNEEFGRGDNGKGDKKFDDSKGGNQNTKTGNNGDNFDGSKNKDNETENMDDFGEVVDENGQTDYFSNFKGPMSCDVDLDYYGILDSRFVEVPRDPSTYGIPNSSELLKNIAVSMYSKAYESSPIYQPMRDTEDENMTLHYGDENLRNYGDENLRQHIYGDENLRQHYYIPSMPKPKMVLANNKKSVKRVKQEGAPLKTYNKKGLATSPVCWAFTGKNKASVQNHRLNQAAKTGIRGSLSLGELKSNSLSSFDRNPKLVQSWPSNAMLTNTEKENPVNTMGNFFLSQGKYNESIPGTNHNRNIQTTSLGQPSQTVFGNKTKSQVESKKFYPTWRPRKPLKPITTVVYDAPPTPFMNHKL